MVKMILRVGGTYLRRDCKIARVVNVSQDGREFSYSAVAIDDPTIFHQSYREDGSFGLIAESPKDLVVQLVE